MSSLLVISARELYYIIGFISLKMAKIMKIVAARFQKMFHWLICLFLKKAKSELLCSQEPNKLVPGATDEPGVHFGFL